MIDFVTSILSGEKPSPTFILSLINISKTIREGMRPWQFLKKTDTSQTVSGSTLYTTPIPMPSDFGRWLNEGAITFFDGNNDVEDITEVPMETILYYKNSYGRYACDYANNQLFVMGLIPKLYTVYQNYIKRTPVITTATTWIGVPDEYKFLLCFDAASRYRLGTDYDDINARNADDNGKAATMIYEAMSEWDAQLAISAINAVDYKQDRYPGIVGGRNGRLNFPNFGGQNWM